MIYNKESLILPEYKVNKTVPQSKESCKEIALDNEEQLFDQLYDTMLKCKRNVMWKPSVKRFVLNGISNVTKLRNNLLNGTYVPKLPKVMEVYYPKRRIIFSNCFKDRIVQTFLVDNYLMPIIGKSFIYSNVASQKNKGTDKALELVHKYMWKEFCKCGTDFYVLQIDIHKYYESIPLDKALALFKQKLPYNIYLLVEQIIKAQYQNGFFAGSQIIQFLGVFYLDEIDHYIKETLGIKYYVRYQDDFLIIHEDSKYLKACLEQITFKLQELGLELNANKTRILKVTKSFLFLGFIWNINNKGCIYKFVNPQRVKHQKYLIKKLSKFLSEEDVLEQSQSFLSYLEKSNSYKAKESILEYLHKCYS